MKTYATPEQAINSDEYILHTLKTGQLANVVPVWDSDNVMKYSLTTPALSIFKNKQEIEQMLNKKEMK